MITHPVVAPDSLGVVPNLSGYRDGAVKERVAADVVHVSEAAGFFSELVAAVVRAPRRPTGRAAGQLRRVGGSGVLAATARPRGGRDADDDGGGGARGGGVGGVTPPACGGIRPLKPAAGVP